MKTTTFRFRVTPEEEAALKQRCHQAGISLSDFIRSRVLEAPTQPEHAAKTRTKSPRKATKPLCTRCARIGVASCHACQHP